MTIEREINKVVNICVNFLHQYTEDILIRIFIFTANDVVVAVTYNCLILLSFHIPSVLGKYYLSWLWILPGEVTQTFIP